MGFGGWLFGKETVESPVIIICLFFPVYINCAFGAVSLMTTGAPKLPIVTLLYTGIGKGYI